MRLAIAFLIGGALLCAVPAAQADEPIGLISFGGGGIFASLAMGDVNDRITNEGNAFAISRNDEGPKASWDPMNELNRGWGYWGEVTLQVPFTGDLPDYLAERLFLQGRYGGLSGASGPEDYNQRIEVEGTQEVLGFRLLYKLPYTFHDNLRLMPNLGLSLIRSQDLTISHTSRSSTGGGSAADLIERTEEVVYSGDGSGYNAGILLEYTLQDRLALTLDLGYQWANVEYNDWELNIEDTEGDQERQAFDRLHDPLSYVYHGFMDVAATERNDPGDDPNFEEYGPHRAQLVPLSPSQLNIDMSGVQARLGFRFYFF